MDDKKNPSSGEKILSNGKKSLNNSGERIPSDERIE